MSESPTACPATLGRGKTILWSLGTLALPTALAWPAVSFGIAVWYAVTRHQGAPPPEVVQSSLFLMGGVGLWATVALWWLSNRKHATFGELFGTRGSIAYKDLPLGALLGAAWIAVYGAVGAVSFDDMVRIDLWKLKSIPLSLSAGVCEELLFRGFLFWLIHRAGGGVWAQIGWSSLIFGLAHFNWGPAGMLWTVALGLTFSGVRAWRGNVWAAVVAHTLLDLCIEPALLRNAMGA